MDITVIKIDVLRHIFGTVFLLCPEIGDLMAIIVGNPVQFPIPNIRIGFRLEAIIRAIDSAHTAGSAERQDHKKHHKGHHFGDRPVIAILHIIFLFPLYVFYETTSQVGIIRCVELARKQLAMHIWRLSI